MTLRMINLMAPLVVGILLGQPLLLAEESESVQLLTSRGLTKQGRYWICPEEVRLRKQIGRLAKAEREFFQARDRYDEFVVRYRRVKTNLERYQAAVTKVEAQLGNKSLSSSQRQQLEGESRKFDQQLKRVQKDLAEMLGKLDESSPLSKTAIGMVNARNELSLLVLAIREQSRTLRSSYKSLPDRDRIAEALQELDGDGRLGPMEGYQKGLSRRLKRLSQAVFTDGAPIYLLSGQYRLSVILQERVPATFSFVGAQGPTLVPRSVVQAAEIEVDPTGRSVEVEVESRKFYAQRVTIPQLRIGKTMIRNVSALVLPPEAEDLGARMSLQALGAHQAALEPKSLWFKVVPSR